MKQELKKRKKVEKTKPYMAIGYAVAAGGLWHDAPNQNAELMRNPVSVGSCTEYGSAICCSCTFLGSPSKARGHVIKCKVLA